MDYSVLQWQEERKVLVMPLMGSSLETLKQSTEGQAFQITDIAKIGILLVLFSL